MIKWFKGLSKLYKMRLAVGGGIIVVAVLLLCTLLPAAIRSKAAEYPIVIVKQAVAKGALITETDLELSATTDKQLAESMTSNSADAVSKYAAADLIAGAPIPPSALSDGELYPDIYSHLENGTVTISMPFQNFAASMSGKIRKDDIVTIFYTDKSEDAEGEISARIPELLRYVRVVAVTDDSSADIHRAGDDTAMENAPATATLLLSEYQATELVKLQQTGFLHLGLACRNENQRAAALLEHQKETNENAVKKAAEEVAEDV